MKTPPLPFVAAVLLTGAAVYQEAPRPAPDYDSPPSVAELQSHYARVEAELLAADLGRWSVIQLEARRQAIETLRRYREDGDFCQSDAGRGFSFTDGDGRRCAVAEILHATGRDDIVERVSAQANDALVFQLAGDRELLTWLDSVGLTVEEAARIQGPGIARRARTRARTANRGSAAEWAGPGDVVTGGNTGGGVDSGRVTPGGGSRGRTAGTPSSASAPTPPATPSTTSSRFNHEVGPEAWWTWWELHRLDYLEPNLIRHWVATVTGWSADGGPHKELDRLRRELAPFIERTLVEGEPEERAAAALVLGRIGGDSAVAPLLVALDDASLFVRERTIFALGATGSPKAAEVLLRLAREGNLEDRGERVCPDVQPLAILALGIGRKNGFDASVDAEIAGLAASEVDRAQRAAVQTAIACYQELSPTPALASWSRDLAGDESVPDQVRCRATEALRFAGDDDSLTQILRNLVGNDLELRRSAALAVGEFDHPMAIQPLLTACEVEKEPLARAFMLVSIGRHGGPEARAFLLDYLENGKKSHRPWCALGLGILAGQENDDEVRTVLRNGVRVERNREWRGAWYLALGIARDERAVPILRDGLQKGSMPELRSAAAFSLAMVGTDQCRELLLGRLGSDPCDFTRGQIAQALGFMGDARDAETLLATLRELPGPDYASTVALGIGLHGSRAALEGLVAVARDDTSDPSVRSAALEALQLLVGQGPSLTLNDLLRQSNFAVFPAVLARHRNLPL